MSLSRKLAAMALAGAAGALTLTGAGSAQAAGDLYGAITYRLTNSQVVAFSAVNQPTQQAAIDVALAVCNEKRGASDTKCTVQVQFVNSCGAIAERAVAFGGGTGATRQEAEGAALAAANSAFSIQDVTGSAQGRGVAQLVHSACNRNAG